jgi:hypothetical protein
MTPSSSLPGGFDQERAYFRVGRGVKFLDQVSQQVSRQFDKIVKRALFVAGEKPFNKGSDAGCHGKLSVPALNQFL